MEVEVMKSEKNDLELSLDNVTIAEIMRVYLNKQNVEFAAWRRDHLTEPAILKVQSSGKTAKKEIGDAISEIRKDLSKISSLVKK
ncbi:MAG: hypothetical protein ABIG28_03200 [archaeon]